MWANTLATQIPDTVAAALAKSAQHGRRPAYIDSGKSYGWPEVEAAAARIADRFIALGIRKGDRIGIILPNQIEWLYVYFAAARIGAVVVGLSVRYRDTELEFILTDSQVRLVVAPVAFAGFDYVRYLSSERKKFPSLRHLVFLGGDAGDAGICFNDLMQPMSTVAHASAYPRPTADDLLLIIYTSGTTGRPKAAGITHRTQLASAAAQAMHTRLTDDDLLQLAMPLNHVGGITCGIVSMMLAGGTCELVAAFNPEVMLSMTRAHPPSMLVGVPTMLTLLMMHPQLPSGDFSRLRLIIVGGSNVEATLLTRLQTAFPQATIMNLYGLSESSGAIVMTPWDAEQQALLQSIGEPLTGAELRVVAPGGHDLPAGEIGELWFRGLGVIPAYVGQQQEDVTFDTQGWLHTGDLGYVDASGQIHLMGRQKDMFIQGGYNVYPAEVEGVIGGHPDVVMAAGIGVPDTVLGEIGRYYVVLKPGSSLTEAELLAHCRDHLADYKVPRQIVFRRELPLTPAGKIQKAALRKECCQPTRST